MADVAATADIGSQAVRRTGLTAQIGYGAGQIAGQVFRDLPSLLLLFFMTTVLGISPAIAGAAIFVPKLVLGAVCDVGVGIMSDRLRHKVARRWWLLVGVFGAPVAMILLFHVPDGSTALQVGYIAGVFTLYMAVFGGFSVPYLAMAGDLTTTPRDRSVVMAWRLVFTAVGILTSGMLAPNLIQHWGGGQDAYEKMSLVLAAVCPAALLVTFFATGKSTPRPGPSLAASISTTRLTAREAMRVLFRSRFGTLLTATLLQLTGAGMGFATMLYFLTYNMARADAFQLIGGLVVAACAAIVIAQPLWLAVSTRFGKLPGYLIATFLYAICYAIWAFAADWGIVVAYTLSFVAAIGQSGWTMLGFSMMSDIAAEDNRNAGLYSAAWIATDKISFALGGTLLVGVILSVFGFDSAKAVLGQPQSDSALLGVMIAFGITPAVLNVIGALLLARGGRH